MPDAAPTPPSEPILLAQDYTRAGPERQWPIPPQCLTAQYQPRSGHCTERQPHLPLSPQPRSRHDCQTNSGETGKPSHIAPTHSPPASSQASTARNHAHIVWFFYSMTSYRLTKPNNKCPLEVPIYDVAPVFNGSPFCFFTGRLV